MLPAAAFKAAFNAVASFWSALFGDVLIWLEL